MDAREKKKLGSKNIVVICVVAVVILSFSAIVLIMNQDWEKDSKAPKILEIDEGGFGSEKMGELAPSVPVESEEAPAEPEQTDDADRAAQARNAERWSEANSILNAVVKYMVDNSVSDPEVAMGITASVRVLGTEDLDLSSFLVNKYLSEMPRDPKTGTAADTGYSIKKDAKGRIKVISDDAEEVEGVLREISIAR